MNVRLVIGIIFLVFAILCLGPMVFTAGMVIQGEGPSTLMLVVFAVPAAVLILIGVLVAGPPHRLPALSWTLVAGAVYGGVVTLMMVSFTQSPEWQQMMQASAAEQGLAGDFQMQITMTRPLIMAGILLAAGMAGLANCYLGGKERRSFGQLLTGETHAGDEAILLDSARPISVTIFCWYLILGAILMFAGFIYPGIESQRTAMEISADLYGLSAGDWQLLMGTFAVLSLILGACMLRGANWARWCYLGLIMANVVFGFVLYGVTAWLILANVFWVALPIYLLFFRKPAARFFNPQPSFTA